MNFIDKLITKVIAKTSQDISKIDYEEIEFFANTLNKVNRCNS
ncbi:hypothetical protein [Anaerobranca californiensis]|jgi:hypothetical protein|nr:hypothetical protein [Anaerobranca californiensis]